MRLNKLSHKSINSWLLLAALFAPIVYLFGVLFTTQLGAHGEQLLADDTYSSYSYFKSDALSRCSIDETIGSPYTLLTTLDNFYTFVPVEANDDFLIDVSFNAHTAIRVYVFDSSLILRSYIQTYTTPYNFSVTKGSYFAFVKYDLYADEVISITLNSSVNYFSSSSNSDYLFGQFFARDNFLAKSGKNVIEGTADYGFQPMGELIRFTDSNMLHLANLEYGYLVIGYCYYAIHVVIVDLILYLTLFIPRLLRNIVERLEGKGNV